MLKRERINRRRYLTVADTRADVFDYIERFHNLRIRRRIDFLTADNRANGNAERFIQTCKREWAYARPYRAS